jgi:hypothetical protein
VVFSIVKIYDPVYNRKIRVLDFFLDLYFSFFFTLLPYYFRDNAQSAQMQAYRRAEDIGRDPNSVEAAFLDRLEGYMYSIVAAIITAIFTTPLKLIIFSRVLIKEAECRERILDQAEMKYIMGDNIYAVKYRHKLEKAMMSLRVIFLFMKNKTYIQDQPIHSLNDNDNDSNLYDNNPGFITGSNIESELVPGSNRKYSKAALLGRKMITQAFTNKNRPKRSRQFSIPDADYYNNGNFKFNGDDNNVNNKMNLKNDYENVNTTFNQKIEIKSNRLDTKQDKEIICLYSVPKLISQVDLPTESDNVDENVYRKNSGIDYYTEICLTISNEHCFSYPVDEKIIKEKSKKATRTKLEIEMKSRTFQNVSKWNALITCYELSITPKYTFNISIETSTKAAYYIKVFLILCLYGVINVYLLFYIQAINEKYGEKFVTIVINPLISMIVVSIVISATILIFLRTILVYFFGKYMYAKKATSVIAFLFDILVPIEIRNHHKAVLMFLKLNKHLD